MPDLSKSLQHIYQVIFHILIISYRRDALIIEAKPISSSEVLDISVIVSTARAATVNHYAEKFVFVRTTGSCLTALIFLVVVIVSARVITIGRRGTVAHIDTLVVLVIVIR